MKSIEPHVSNLIAFLAVVVLIGVIMLNRSNSADIAIMTGLIGVLGSFKPWSNPGPLTKQVEVTNTPENPVQTEQANGNSE